MTRLAHRQLPLGWLFARSKLRTLDRMILRAEHVRFVAWGEGCVDGYQAPGYLVATDARLIWLPNNPYVTQVVEFPYVRGLHVRSSDRGKLNPIAQCLDVEMWSENLHLEQCLYLRDMEGPRAGGKIAAYVTQRLSITGR